MKRELLQSYDVGSASTQDRLDIQDTIGALTFYLDCGQFDKAEALFAPDATFDYSSVYGPAFACVPLKEFFASIRAQGELFDSSQHQITNCMIQVSGDTASVCSQVRATMGKGGKFMHMGAIYRHTLVRRVSRWLVATLAADVLYQYGDKLLLDSAEDSTK